VPQPSLPIGAFLGALPPGLLAGREDEIAHIEPVLEVVESGSGQLVLLCGEAGVGRTRLAQEVSRLARDRGFLVVTGRCFESERDSPLFPFLELMPAAYESAPATVRARVQRQWPQLRRVLPDQMRAIGDDREEDGQSLFRAVTSFLAAIADQRPLAILIDDVHWSDEGSLRLLQHLARHTRNKRVFLLGTYLESAPVRDGVLDRILRELARERLVDRMTLGKLGPDGTAAMVAEAIGDMEGLEDFAAFVHRRTKGNPALVDEMLRTLGGRYRLVRQVGSGGMGRVFQAVDTRTGKVVAAKILFASSEADLAALLRFQQEGAVLSTLKHPNIVQVYGTFLEEHTSCIIMELLEGASLRQVLERETLGLARLKSIAQQAARALAYAHSKSIVHRDVKPDNIMILPGDQVKVTDFGIARILSPGGTLNTMTGMTMGTPLYMAPEQIAGRDVDGRADVYSLGAVLYQALVGRPPFEGDDPITVAFRQVQAAPAAPSTIRDGIPPDWEELILRALAKAPADRFPSAAAIEHAIADLTVEENTLPIERPPAAVDADMKDATGAPAPETGRRSPLRILTPPAVRPPPPATAPAGVPAPSAPSRRPDAARSRAFKKLYLLGALVPLAAIALAVVFVVRGQSGSSSPPSSVLGQPDPGWKVHTNTLAFSYPVGVAVSGQTSSLTTGTIYIADRLNHRIARLAADGTPLAPWGSEGSGNGQFERPDAVAVAPDGDVYVADTGNNRVEVLEPDGRFLSSFGRSGNVQLNEPTDVAVAAPPRACPACRPNVYVVDSGNNRLIELTPSGALLHQWKPEAGQISQAALANVALGPGGAVYASDSGNNQIDVVKGSRLQKLFGSAGLATGQLSGPKGLAVDGNGNVYVADSGNNRIQRFDPPLWSARPWATSTRLSSPQGLTVAEDGSLYVADASNNLVRKFSSAGALTHSWAGVLAAGQSILSGPAGIATDRAGDVFVADSNNDRIDEIAPDGVLVASSGTTGSRPGQFQSPAAIAAGSAGHVYVADSLNNRIQELSAAGPALSTGGFASPSGIALSGSGAIYVADTGNERIRELAHDGTVIRSWGSGGPGNGQFQSPYGVAVDTRGNVYVADQNNNRIQVFDPAGHFLFAFGTTGSGIGGSQPGQFSGPEAVVVDLKGAIYVADTGNNRIQELTKSGSVLGVIGGMSTKDRFKNPQGIAVDSAGNVYVADNGRNRLVKIVPR
jgi:serine/threonine protein kinase/DNA-binding beta-propeller fold protein YncE